MIKKMIDFIAGLAVVAVFFVVLASITAFPVMWMWNYVMPALFGLPVLTFWQALWGTLLCRLLFTSASANVKNK